MPPPSCPRPRIYLAGPDVFFPDAARCFAELRATCEELGLQAVQPSDGNMPPGFSGSEDERAQRIYDANLALLRSADGVAANLMAWRGLEPDPGTVFEVGFAVALGKPVVGYGVPAESYAQRVRQQVACARDAAGVLREQASGLMVEGLGQRLNLMLTRSTPLASSARAALQQLARTLAAAPGER